MDFSKVHRYDWVCKSCNNRAYISHLDKQNFHNYDIRLTPPNEYILK